MNEAPTLEQALDRLDEIAVALERGDLELADALALYEEGVRLLRVADVALAAVEERIHQLAPSGTGGATEPLPE